MYIYIKKVSRRFRGVLVFWHYTCITPFRIWPRQSNMHVDTQYCVRVAFAAQSYRIRSAAVDAQLTIKLGSRLSVLLSKKKYFKIWSRLFVCVWRLKGIPRFVFDLNNINRTYVRVRCAIRFVYTVCGTFRGKQQFFEHDTENNTGYSKNIL